MDIFGLLVEKVEDMSQRTINTKIREIKGNQLKHECEWEREEA